MNKIEKYIAFNNGINKHLPVGFYWRVFEVGTGVITESHGPFDTWSAAKKDMDGEAI